MNMMKVCLGSNWLCAYYRTCRFPGNCLRWILSGRCYGVLGWGIPEGSRIGDLDRPVVGKWKWKGTQDMRWDFPRKLSVRTVLGKVEGYLVGNSKWTLARLCAPSFCIFEGVLVGNWDGDVLGQSYGGLFRR